MTDPTDIDYGDGRVRRIPHGSREPKPARRSVGKPAARRPIMDSPPLLSEESDVSPMTPVPEATRKEPSISSDGDSTSASSNGAEITNAIDGNRDANGDKKSVGPDDASGNGAAAGDYFFSPVAPAPKQQPKVERPVDSGVSMSAGLAGRPPLPAADEPERQAAVATTESTQPRKLSIAFQDKPRRRDSAASASNAGSNASSNGGSNESSQGSSDEGSDRGGMRKQSVSSISLRSLSNRSVASAEPRKSSVSFQDVLPKPDYSTANDIVDAWSRKRSISSMSFRNQRNPSPTDGELTPASESRSRPPSPPHQRHDTTLEVPEGALLYATGPSAA
ncbi:hypothetical protein JDV02_002839 [Purpureocillium takamizusanense]|uniref:Uncharacterized protein n=1 Tax=Purpureocillium takamizusanense TaxID=2060973 RepID=A0A9Q8Q9H1_9HYPO|nr:uncharacterized protein JDV02_002839 [Purpureocillium takamizusanense]UNI16404.1 hypothetical protein JDV02_002839 [Purpureocillium takamizusanense]